MRRNEARRPACENTYRLLRTKEGYVLGGQAGEIARACRALLYGGLQCGFELRAACEGVQQDMSGMKNPALSCLFVFTGYSFMGKMDYEKTTLEVGFGTTHEEAVNSCGNLKPSREYIDWDMIESAPLQK